MTCECEIRVEHKQFDPDSTPNSLQNNKYREKTSSYKIQHCHVSPLMRGRPQMCETATIHHLTFTIKYSQTKNPIQTFHQYLAVE